MGALEELQKAYNHGNGPWHHFLRSIKITNIHGWNAQEIKFDFPIVAIVGENGIGKSTFLKAAVCAYKNKSGKTFYPSKMFMSTQWDKDGLEGALIEYKVKVGDSEKDLKWKKTKDWGFTPKTNKPERNVYFLDISRTVPLDATAGYAKVAMTSNTEAGKETVLTDESIRDLSFVLGQHYIKGRFTNTNVDESREVGLLTKECGEISQFHQGAGEDTILDMFKLLQEIPEQSLLIIDEVENSLHPQAQRRFIKFLIKCTKRKRLQIILSTHSPFVLDELPPISRIMLHSLSDKKDIIYQVSTKYALSHIDEIEHPEIFIHVEDDEAIALLWAILKTKTSLHDDYLKIIYANVVGSYSVVRTLNDLAMKGKLPYKSISIVDGDKKTECPNCLSFPGCIAPEKMVFEQLKQKNWNKLDERFGIGAGILFKYLDDAMLLPDHHEWTTDVGNKIKQSKDYVWKVMVEEWCKQCLSDDEANQFIQALQSEIDRLTE